MQEMKSRDIIKLIVSIVACQGAGLIGSLFTTTAIPTWYTGLQKPFFTPPNWVFAPAWTTLYMLMAVAAFLIWRKGLDQKGVRLALIIFLIQLVLNTLWSIVFFGLESPFYGIMVIIALWIAILLTMIKFFKLSTMAGVLMTPYIGWVSFAAVLNVAISMLNP
jgi:benzodiazapine receptor